MRPIKRTQFLRLLIKNGSIEQVRLALKSTGPIGSWRQFVSEDSPASSSSLEFRALGSPTTTLNNHLYNRSQFYPLKPHHIPQDGQVSPSSHLLPFQNTILTPFPQQLSRLHLRHRTRQSKLQFLLQNRRLPTRRPLFSQTRQAFLLPNHPPPKPLPKPRLRSQKQDECKSTAEPLRCVL